MSEDMNRILRCLRDEARDCRETSIKVVPEYKDGFWVCAIVLENLADKLEAKTSRDEPS